MANNYSRGTSNNIIVGAAALYTFNGSLSGSIGEGDLPDFVAGESYKETLATEALTVTDWRNVGYTSNGLELQFMPDFGEVKVDQVLDVARLFKQGMKVTMATQFAEATLENLLVSIAAADADKAEIATGTGVGAGSEELDLQSGELGAVPLERGIVAVGPGTGDPSVHKERIYVGYRALSIDNVTVAAKRDAATEFAVSFRMLPIDNGSYGKIVDRVIA
jgi:hypothetical protein